MQKKNCLNLKKKKNIKNKRLIKFLYKYLQKKLSINYVLLEGFLKSIPLLYRLSLTKKIIFLFGKTKEEKGVFNF